MKNSTILLLLMLAVSCASSKEKKYTASTPADPVIRSFLGISLTDSIDFIRWKLTLDDNQYHLHCNYGIGKANTNGFINGGKQIELKGGVKKEKSHYVLQNNTKSLKLLELNSDLLHLLAKDNLLVGNGGWSYTLNNIAPMHTDQINLTAKPAVFKDSMAVQGRTPCGVPGVIAPGTECYKLKWHIILYTNSERKPGLYKIYGTPWRKEDGKKGNWEIVTGKDGRIIYQLNDDKGNGFLYLLKLDEYVLVFTDAQGKLLVGNEDFSYTMNGSER